MSKDGVTEQDRVIALSQADTTATRFPMLESVERYWNSLRINGQLPARSEIDPKGLERALSRCFILERVAPGVARFRLSGSHLNDLLGMEVRGMPLTSFFLPDARKAVGDALAQVFDTPATARLTLVGDRGIGKPPMDAALLLLPLRSDLGEVTRILGCLPTLGPVGRTPRRFDIRQTRVTPIAGIACPTEREAGHWPAQTNGKLEGVLDGMAEAPAEFTPAPVAPRPPRSTGKPHLYLVSSRDD
ncbi:PAS domain-containing protein [Tropicimonas sediminicola]|uniref:PAS domain-containing protein n=1 Tax=Tropicimonas sediminicola TaxID=1031541 RepID=A0A239JSD0_9RHOB|nr:PAS domain-containing protein [Tropicimonas sediminicola]SNT08760.1 PAS domain-containing protein [Tropicimonas sediminicola]